MASVHSWWRGVHFPEFHKLPKKHHFFTTLFTMRAICALLVTRGSIFQCFTRCPKKRLFTTVFTRRAMFALLLTRDPVS
jgi:hypothetical protein